jgi:peptidoglycan hydrolase-like protein with peptidoglycan-binding domain
MTSPVAGYPLRYLIGKADDEGISGTATVVGYDTTALPTHGIGVGYINRRQEAKGRLPGVDYIDPPDDIENDYGEPAPVFGTDYFWTNINKQCSRLKALGFEFVEIDNLDTDSTDQALQLLDHVSGQGFSIFVKNPNFVDGDNARLVSHPFCVAMICEHDDEVTAKSLNDKRKEAQRNDMPVRVVTYGNQLAWANKIADEARTLNLIDFGVTHSGDGEYKSVTHILRPSNMPTPELPAKPWNATLEDTIGKYHDGPDVPAMATRTARRFPDNKAMASYVTQMGNSTAWCGLFCGDQLSIWKIMPPFKNTGTGGWAYVDAWIDFGTGVDPNQREDGDLAIWYLPGKPPHHIAFCWKGKYLGGNQNNTVNISNFRLPDVVRRPPAPVNYTPQPEAMPMLMIESSGDTVRYLQTLLNADLGITLDVDGEFGPATEAAVMQYQTKYSLEVDGIVGPATWEVLMASDKPVPKPPPAGALTSDQVLAIMDMAKDSAIAKYSWKARGVAPIGYTQGIAVMFAQCLLKLKANDSQALVMSQPIGTSSKDALAWYTITATGREDVLRKNFTMLMGLGMRESSGNYTEGRDTTASNVTADTCEAGLFQQSWNSAGASNEMKKLLPEYETGGQPCYVNVFKQGVKPKVTKSYGDPDSDGYDFQELAKDCPAFATEMAAIGIRVLYNHWGPIVRKEVEFRAECETLLAKVAAYIELAPEPEPPPPITDDIAIAKAKCMTAIEAAVNQLIADLVKIPTDDLPLAALEVVYDRDPPPPPPPPQLIEGGRESSGHRDLPPQTEPNAEAVAKVIDGLIAVLERGKPK